MASNKDNLDQIEHTNQYSLEEIDQEIEKFWIAMDTNLDDSDGSATANTTNEAVPALADVISGKAKNRKIFGKGDMAIILDPNDLSKTLLLAHQNLLSAAINFQRITTVDGPSEIKYAII